jgi:hypothetical protein
MHVLIFLIVVGVVTSALLMGNYIVRGLDQDERREAEYGEQAP